jgi:hypothetical protein
LDLMTGKKGLAATATNPRRKSAEERLVIGHA